jgi:4-hydroxy-tetrahydrodipicolinate synthase
VKSTFVISLTPFKEDESLDEAALRAHLARLREAGIGVYLAGSGSGEGYSLSEDETRRILQIGVEELKGRVPVRAMGVEPRTAKQMVRIAAVAQESGVDALQVYSLDAGHGTMPTNAEMEAYYRDVLESITIPAVISTHQSVGYWIPIPLIASLVDQYNVIGVNVTTPDHGYLLRVIDAVGDRVEIHCGGPMHALSTMALGGTGYLSSEGNIAPKLCVSLITHWEGGNLEAAASAYSTIMHLLGLAMRFTHITGAKTALDILGLPGGIPRRPRLLLGGAEREEVATTLETLGIARIEGLERAAVHAS